MSIEDFARRQLTERETRGQTPEFQTAMRVERATFARIFDNLASNTFNAGVTIFY